MSVDSRKRILFVDDEPPLLRTLARELRSEDHRWQTRFCSSGHDAIELMRTETFDVVVSDLRMPGMDGVALLERVRQEFPNTVRIIRSSNAERGQALRAVPFAHQFLAKEEDRKSLTDCVDRACSLQALVNDKVIRRLLGSIGSLPSSPTSFLELGRIIENPNASFATIAAVIEKDTAMSAKIMQLANSAFIGLPRQIKTVSEAVRIIGIDTIRQFVVTPLLDVFTVFHNRFNETEFSLEELRTHGLMTARVAKHIAGRSSANDAFVAGLLHDIGRLIFATHLPDLFALILAEAKASSAPAEAVELELTGVTHADLGAYLLGIWGLDYTIVEAVADHHRPHKSNRTELDAADAVYLANWLVQEAMADPIGKQNDVFRSPIDVDFLTERGLVERVGEWLEFARNTLATADQSPPSA
jgi:putative nucleotidyltransferase with HDIG domain